MPTPESAAFLAKKPTVAPTYEGVDFEDNVALHNARDAIIREQWVRSMMARLVGEELGKCYAREGVNHFEKCGVLRGENLFFLVLLILEGGPCFVNNLDGSSLRDSKGQSWGFESGLRSSGWKTRL